MTSYVIVVSCHCDIVIVSVNVIESLIYDFVIVIALCSDRVPVLLVL